MRVVLPKGVFPIMPRWVNWETSPRRGRDRGHGGSRRRAFWSLRSGASKLQTRGQTAAAGPTAVVSVWILGVGKAGKAGV